MRNSEPHGEQCCSAPMVSRSTRHRGAQRRGGAAGHVAIVGDPAIDDGDLGLEVPTAIPGGLLVHYDGLAGCRCGWSDWLAHADECRVLVA